jgi:hypothetical protein
MTPPRLPLLLSTALLAAVAYAFPDADGTLHTCVNKKNGKIRVVENGTTCRAKEQAVTMQSTTPLAFTEATLVNGWTDAQLGYGTASVSYARDERGVVHLRGTIDGSASTGPVAFVLPDGFRPASGVFTTAFFDGSPTPGGVRIRTNGEVTPWDPVAFIPQHTSPVILDGVSFAAAGPGQ